MDYLGYSSTGHLDVPEPPPLPVELIEKKQKLLPEIKKPHILKSVIMKDKDPKIWSRQEKFIVELIECWTI